MTDRRARQQSHSSRDEKTRAAATTFPTGRARGWHSRDSANYQQPMTLNNNFIINYGQPFNSSFRWRRRRFAGLNFNDWAPEMTGMHAHLRASAYRDKQHAARSANRLHSNNSAGAERTGLSFNLLREYENQVRDNFAKEAGLFAIIIAIGLVWPIAHVLNFFVR